MSAGKQSVLIAIEQINSIDRYCVDCKYELKRGRSHFARMKMI